MTWRDKAVGAGKHPDVWHHWRYTTVRCPRCRAGVGWRCRADGRPMQLPHRERIGAWLAGKVKRSQG